MKLLTALTFSLSLFGVYGRNLIGQDPKTWSPTNDTIVLSCDQCKVLVGLVESVDLCTLLPEQYQGTCESILPAIEQKYTPDTVCQCISLCEVKHNFHF